MIWVALEVLIAAGLLIFIVWWTMPRKKKPSQSTQNAKDDRPESQ